MKIADIIRKRSGVAGAWRVVDQHSGAYTLYHYSTPMLNWVESDGRPMALDTRIGWGSVSDQNGMNTAFRVLGLALYYSRDIKGGGARIEATA